MEDEVDAATIGVAGASRGRTRRPRADGALARAAQSGDQSAIAELFERHWDAAHRAAYWIVHDAVAAEDIAQEAFLSALGALERFDRRRPFAPWLHRMVVNRAIDHARARSLRREVGAEALVAHLPDGQSLLTTASSVPNGIRPERRLRVGDGRVEEDE